MPDVLDTAGALLAEGGSRLRRAGIAHPAREALRLWADLTDSSPGATYLAPERAVDPDDAAAFLAAVGRRAAGAPLPYVTGRVGFRTLDLRIDRRALIPRPETEGLVELVLASVPGGRVADIGTGSGCIALSLAAEGRYQSVLAIERSRDALALARLNRSVSGVRIALAEGDLAAALATASLDAVVSNPPYLTEHEYATLDPAVTRWEPREALASGPDGLDTTRRLLHEGIRVLRPGGLLALEVDASRAADVASLAVDLGWEGVEVRVDLFGRERYLLALRSEKP